MTLAHGGGGGGGSGSAGGSRRLEPDPVAGVWARVSPSLLRPPLVFRSVAGAAAMAERGLEPSPAAVAALPPEVRAQLAELELELSEGRRAAGRASGRAGGGLWAAGLAGLAAPHPRSAAGLSLLSLGGPQDTGTGQLETKLRPPADTLPLRCLSPGGPLACTLSPASERGAGERRSCISSCSSNNARCLTSDRREKGAGEPLKVRGRLEAVALTQRDPDPLPLDHFRPGGAAGFSWHLYSG